MVSPFVLALSAVYLYLSKSKCCGDIIWNTSVHGRYYGEDLLDKMGMFVKMKALVLNCGSSSIKYQLLDMENESVVTKGLVERIGLNGSRLKYQVGDAQYVVERMFSRVKRFCLCIGK